MCKKNVLNPEEILKGLSIICQAKYQICQLQVFDLMIKDNVISVRFFEIRIIFYINIYKILIKTENKSTTHQRISDSNIECSFSA
jgi:hypothetical protein